MIITRKNTIIEGLIVILIAAGLLVFSPQTANSTGCPINFLGENIQNAKIALENWDKKRS